MSKPRLNKILKREYPKFPLWIYYDLLARAFPRTMMQTAFELGQREAQLATVPSMESTLRSYAESPDVRREPIARVIVEAGRHKVGFTDYVLGSIELLMTEYDEDQPQFDRLLKLAEEVREHRELSVS